MVFTILHENIPFFVTSKTVKQKTPILGNFLNRFFVFNFCNLATKDSLNLGKMFMDFPY